MGVEGSSLILAESRGKSQSATGVFQRRKFLYSPLGGDIEDVEGRQSLSIVHRLGPKFTDWIA
jgi:hypothetical protein